MDLPMVKSVAALHYRAGRYDLVPDEMKKLRQWVCAKDGEKRPWYANQQKPASTTYPPSWNKFEIAVRSVYYGQYPYIGFVFSDNGIVGIDIDTGYEDGMMTPEACEVIKRCGSYTERSRSGRGFHILLKGKLPFGGRNNRKGMEIYQTGRYFIITADVIRGYETLSENQDAIDWVLKTHFADAITPKDNSTTPAIYPLVYPEIEGNFIPLQPVYTPIGTGSRHESLLSIGGQLRNSGYSPEEIEKTLTELNQTICDTPLPEDELLHIISSVERYRHV